MASFPFMALLKWFGPAIEVFSYLFLSAGLLLGFVSFKAWLVLCFAGISMGILLSVSAFFLEELSFHVYPKAQTRLSLFSRCRSRKFWLPAIELSVEIDRSISLDDRKERHLQAMTRKAPWQTR